jgi:ABC-type transport system involved in multi-copper enzyme maturation permease subunit
MSDSSNLLADRAVPASTGFWTQTGALLLDAYRDLQSRRLFWLTLVLSLLVAGVFAFVGIDLDGITIFGKHLRGIPFNSALVPPPDFYKYLFTAWAIPIWLGFLAQALALVAVGGIFPDTISSGSIELYLSRPIGRLRLFITKYIFALSFTALQVLLFTIVSFLVIGIRGGAWELRIFLAIPLVTLLFSYLYCICVLVGVVMRSTLASLLVTALFWGMLTVVHLADMGLTTTSAAAQTRVNQTERLMAANQDLIDRNNALAPDKRGDMSAFEFQLQKQKESLPDFEATLAELRWWHQLALNIKTPLPKLNETVGLMTRWLLRPGLLSDMTNVQAQDRQQRRQRFGGPATRRGQSVEQYFDSQETQQEVLDEVNSRRVSWIIGSSVGFEVVILALAAWVFCRRDY